MKHLLLSVAIVGSIGISARAADIHDQRPAQVGITFTVHHGGSPAAPSTWLRVQELTPGAAAERAGVRRGDVITEFNGQAINFRDEVDLLLTIAKLEVDKPATLTIYRGNQRQTITVIPTRMSSAQYEQWKAAVAMLQAQRAQRAALQAPPPK
ncbi:MAG: Peptidase family [Thermoanaerobaculia bacterium]|jgi:S1-C subfamily serine protease|nr:Peptidase family [Thermoanaerobaculia bacterium]